MADWRAEIEGSSIVLLGRFNPAIFQPSWFDHHGLIRPEEAESARKLVSVDELTAFQTGWLALQVTPNRFEVSIPDLAHVQALRDLVLGTFTLLEHTPFDRMGLNRIMHFKLDERRYLDFGHHLAPKRPWQDVLDDPRTRSLVMEGGQTRGAERVRIQVKVEPSPQVQPGVAISTNEHYEVPAKGATPRLMNALRANWSDAQAAARRIAEHLLHQVA